jgi:hypothetical protein
MVYGKTYYYDSQTRGAYSAEGEATGDRVERVTWDYWDADHRGNLAIETWPDGRLELYISQVIDPQSVVVQPRGLQMPIALNHTAAIATVDSPAIAEPNTTAAPAVDPSDASLQASVLAQPGISAAAIAMQSLNRAKEAAIDRELAWQLMMGAIVKIILGLIMLSLGFIVLFVP